MRRTLTLTLALAVAIVGLATLLQAGPLDMELRGATFFAKLRGRNMGTRVVEQIMDELRLDRDQREQVNEIMEQYQPRIVALRKGMEASGLRLLDTDPDDPDYADVVDRIWHAPARCRSTCCGGRPRPLARSPVAVSLFSGLPSEPGQVSPRPR